MMQFCDELVRDQLFSTFGKMGLKRYRFLLRHLLGFLILSVGVHSDDSGVAFKLLRTPHEFSKRNYASFSFRVVRLERNGGICNDCSANCKLDNGNFSVCDGGKISYTRLTDGNHSFEACTSRPRGVSCTSYNWTVDTIRPTAHIKTPTSFTNASQIPVNISFSEPCGGGDGFTCSSVNDCNFLVYGPGEVLPSTLNVLEPNMKYSVMVAISESVQYGRLILVMDKNFCSDAAGNKFTRTSNSSLFIHFDKRSVLVNLRTHIPERQLQINSETRTVLATSKSKNLKVYLYFTEPVMNSSAEILNTLNANEGFLVPIAGSSFGLRRFGYQLVNISDFAIVTVSLNSDMVISRQGTPVAPISPITFLYDSQRPSVKISTTCNTRTKEKNILIFIKFIKPVFGFNSSSISISGGYLQSFLETSRSSYAVRIEANSDAISIHVPENVTMDVSGNENKASNTLQLKHYSVPLESWLISLFATGAFALTASIAGLLTVSTASLLSAGAFSKPSSILCCDPKRNLFRIASHLQVFALSKWLAVTLPVEYYELTRGLQWTVPYFNLPWESANTGSVMVGSNSRMDRLSSVSEVHDSISFIGRQPEVPSTDSAGKLFGLPLSPMEYRSYFESQTFLPEAEYILDPQNSHGWRNFSRSMFWLAAIGGSLIFLHALLLMILKLRKQKKEKQIYGPLVFPRFEIFLIVLALPCVCETSAALINGGTSTGTIVGILILSLVASLLLSLLLFLSFGISFGKLLQYKEVHHVGQKFHWYQEIIRVTLGPGKRGQWTWKNQPSSIYLAILGPLFEDLRGPPKYMLSQITGGSLNKTAERIMDSDDETEDAEAPCIQKLFGILRIYYTLIECMKRLILGIMAGVYSETRSSRTPAITLLSITSFQLFFMLLKKPFIKKKIQLVEIVAVTCEVAVFAISLILVDREFSPQGERKIGITLLSLFLFAFVTQMMNEWYALYIQVKQLDPVSSLFFRGLGTASIGFLLLVFPHCLIKKFESRFPINNEVDATSTYRTKSLGSRSSGEKPWLTHIRELARSSFSREGSKSISPNDPSTSKTRWSEFWKIKKSGSSSASTSIDYKSKPRGLHKELEEIFASK